MVRCGAGNEEIVFRDKFRNRCSKFLEDLCFKNTKECASHELLDQIYDAVCSLREMQSTSVDMIRVCCAYAEFTCDRILDKTHGSGLTMESKVPDLL
ncbi:protein MpMTPSL29 [Marchantia polymorpha subsp. ruderalis]|uniref:Uncharacterized protein n=2 Tax=Marchantia polymorpha TaxID=3197 RepID=A0AAF6BNF1_MARPO|nr:hypothetical protein MARPO_0034s0081 [Marchantia polymorpha]BBN13535.1 hypothetical protein Mp_6g04300 [Marchantia polymorpha subsp. ruderalis]PTQ41500.1 hypothetical protein MARPO_0034s0085 [Marchantia polymorpha]PTQ41503.1 hypothetical protein MARPO_0034s0088 [Marchantia polymorpha]PTQ41505.1 hypothetical protein MARPO_0034s0090 [Marchantia polymorpha]|eukprot:PTQ41496.1 hypothetical protein MARPO_0034s0081 [Marchantia polymorpha]